MRPTPFLLSFLPLLSACPTGGDDDTSGEDTLPPVVAIVEPSSGALLSGTVTVRVSAEDAGGLAFVRILVDGTDIAVDRDTPYEAWWDTTLSVNGSHTLSAVATDQGANSSETAISVDVDNGGLPPNAVTLTNPVDGSTVCGTLSLTAAAVPEVLAVEFAVDGVPIGTDSVPPFEASWDTLAFPNGEHAVRVVGSDADGNEAQDAATVTVENGGNFCDNLPTVSITTPAEGAAVDGLLPITASASDDKGVRRVEFFLDGGMFLSDEAIPYAAELDTTLFDEGPHTLRAVAYDTAEQTAQANVTVNIDRTPPDVEFLAPSPGALVNGLLTVAVDADDNVGVDGVELFVDGDSQGVVTAAPYEWTVDGTSLDSGDVELLAVATDLSGKTAEANRTVTVDWPPEVNITAPGATVSACSTTISASASDDLGLVSVTFTVDGSPIGTDTTSPYSVSWDVAATGAGSHTIEVTARDTRNQMAVDSQGVTVNLDGDGDGETLWPCGGDCDDADAGVYSGATEVCDGIDNNCDEALLATEQNDDGDPAPICAGDCDDDDATVYPGAVEVCDGVDNDCVGGVPAAELTDADGDGAPTCADCADNDAARFVGNPEACDGIDNDCDGVVPTDETTDGDGDGFLGCEDCDDGDPTNLSSACAEGIVAQGISFLVIPAGTFTMGCVTGRDDVAGGCYSYESPSHSVTLTHSFWMAETETTQGQFQALMGYNPSYFTGCGADCPVEDLDWHESAAFANAVSAAEGLAACYSCTGSGSGVSCAPLGSPYLCDGYRLPTEAEWEYAARGAEAYPYAGSATVGDVGWYSNNSGSTTHPVGAKAPNAFGLYDMTGNVWEWTGDWYGSYSASSANDPTGASSGSGRVLRGGGWSLDAWSARVAARSNTYPSLAISGLGFRLARTIP